LHSRFSALENPSWYLEDIVHPSVEGAKHLAEIVYAHLQMDTLLVMQDGSTLKAPKGFGYQWYKDGKLLDGETLETLAISGDGEYKVSVKVDERTLSRIVTAPLKVEKTTALKPGVREIARERSAGAANMAKSAQRFDAQGRVLNARGPSHQKIYIKR
jgi:hypothetical protein